MAKQRGIFLQMKKWSLRTTNDPQTLLVYRNDWYAGRVRLANGLLWVLEDADHVLRERLSYATRHAPDFVRFLRKAKKRLAAEVRAEQQ